MPPREVPADDESGQWFARYPKLCTLDIGVIYQWRKPGCPIRVVMTSQAHIDAEFVTIVGQFHGDAFFDGASALLAAEDVT